MGVGAGDVLDRDFTVALPNQTWVTDLADAGTWGGNTHVSFMGVMTLGRFNRTPGGCLRRRNA